MDSISRALSRPAKSGEVTIERIDDGLDTNPNNLSVAEQVQHMQLAIAEVSAKLGEYASRRRSMKLH